MERPSYLDRHVRPLYRRAKSLAGRWGVDRRERIETARTVYLSDLGYSGHELAAYEATGWHEIGRALIPGEVDETDVFVDIGSGMGRVVFEAALEYPFRRVIGVELIEELHEIACSNIDQNRGRLMVDDVELVCADASTWPVPDDVSVVYLYNPVLGETFTAMIGQIVASLDRNPRRLRIVYRAPVEHDRLMATGRFELRRVVRPRLPRRLWTRAPTHVYEALGSPV